MKMKIKVGLSLSQSSSVSPTLDSVPVGETHCTPGVSVNQVCFHVPHAGVPAVLDFILNFKPGHFFGGGLFILVLNS